ncbi:MAG: DUF4118 domain-containing protein [Anaerolineales bacterium]|nr:DUF4118 domain-containing protein [Anaerolineales bacterium]
MTVRGSRSIWPRVLTALWGAVLIAVMTALLLPLRDLVDRSTLALLYLLPVGLSTARWGLAPGALAAGCAFLAFNYFFLPPYGTLTVRHSQDVIILGAFFVVAVVISQLVGRARAGRAAAQARERETAHLYELSTALASARSEGAMARITAEHLRGILPAEYVEVVVQPAAGEAARTYSAPAAARPPARAPSHTLALSAAHKTLGEVRAWLPPAGWSAVDDRFLRIFASQCALALERALLAQNEQRTKVLEESDRLKSALLSSVSHELRTPLASIKTAVTSLRGDDTLWSDPPALDELLEVIEEDTDLLNRLVGNLLDMSRIEAGALKPRRQWSVLSELITNVLTRMRRATGTHQLAVELPGDLPLVPLDYVQLEQVFTNLVSNSLKYAPAGTVIRLRAWVEPADWLQVEVSNQGPPVAVENLERIFDKFFRVTAADRVTGTGLGLSVCRGIVEAHGGRIWAANQPPPGGLAFHFTLPLVWEGAAPRVPTDSELEAE